MTPNFCQREFALRDRPEPETAAANFGKALELLKPDTEFLAIANK